MAYNEAPQYPGYLGGPPFISQPLNNEGPLLNSDRGQQRDEPPAATSYLHGEALARDLWAERYGPWIILSFTAIFVLFLLFMQLIQQVPGKSFTL